MIELVDIRVGQRILIFSTRQPTSNPNGLRDLHEQFCADDRLRLLFEPLQDDLGAVALIVRL